MEKKDIALRQLRAACKLFKSGDYVSAATLSGAAEEILGKLANKRKGTNEMEKEILFLRSLYEYAKKEFPDKKVLVQRINRVKNELKHNDVGENSWVEADFEFEATELYIKAIKNYFNAYKEIPKDRIVMGLFEFLTL